MCGIAGYFGHQRLSSKVISSTLHLMKSRVVQITQIASLIIKEIKRINLLHSRLSIIDLRQRSNQPFVIGNYVIIFNGEIYNFESLRKNLNIQNTKFSTNSDTSIIKILY